LPVTISNLADNRKNAFVRGMCSELLQRGVLAVDEFLEVTEWALGRRAETGTQLITDDPPVWFLPSFKTYSALIRSLCIILLRRLGLPAPH
jgi:hypothetical protein